MKDTTVKSSGKEYLIEAQQDKNFNEKTYDQLRIHIQATSQKGVGVAGLVIEGCWSNL